MSEMKEYRVNQLNRTHWSLRTRAILSLVGGVMVHLALGAYYTFGNMAPYIISYLRVMSGEPSLVNVDSLWITNVGVFAGPVSMVIGGAVEKRFGCRVPTIIGTIIYSAGAGLTYFSIKQSLALVCVTYGVVVQFGSFMAYGVPIQTAARWFPKRPALVIGIIMCGFGGSTLILNQVITGYINPENMSPDLETDDGEKYFTDRDLLNRVPNVFLILASIYITLSLFGAALMSEPTDEDTDISEKDRTYSIKLSDNKDEHTPIPGAMHDTDVTEYINNQIVDETQGNKEEQSVKSKTRQPIKQVLLTMVKNRNSYVILSVTFFVFAGMQFNISLYKAYGQTFISDDKFLALVGSLAAVFNCLFRPIWGFIMDKYGFQVTTKILSASFVCIMTTISLTEKLGKAAFMVWMCASYASFCGIFPIGPSTMGKLFGAENMVINMSFTFLAVALATLFGGLSGLTLKAAIGWHGLFLMSGCFGVIAFFSSFFFNGKDENGKDI